MSPALCAALYNLFPQNNVLSSCTDVCVKELLSYDAQIKHDGMEMCTNAIYISYIYVFPYGDCFCCLILDGESWLVELLRLVKVRSVSNISKGSAAGWYFSPKGHSVCCPRNYIVCRQVASLHWIISNDKNGLRCWLNALIYVCVLDEKKLRNNWSGSVHWEYGPIKE